MHVVASSKKYYIRSVKEFFKKLYLLLEQVEHWLQWEKVLLLCLVQRLVIEKKNSENEGVKKHLWRV